MKMYYLLPLFVCFAFGKPLQIEEPTQIEVQLDSSQTDSLPYNTKITITHFTPYCGGAAPDQFILENQTQFQRLTTFLLLNVHTGEKLRVKTDSSGVLYLNLPKGVYAIREQYKDCSFETFLAENPAPTGEYYMPSADFNCYRNWWVSNLVEIQITDTSKIQEFHCGTSESCFTGNNPCIYYNGPYPP